MSVYLMERPGIVRQSEDLAELAAQINAEHEAGEEATRRGLEHYRAAGERLTKAKEQCGHGKWLPWLKKNVRFSQPQAAKYMRVAANWSKLESSSNLADALRLLTDDAPDEDDNRPADSDEGDGEPAPPRPFDLVSGNETVFKWLSQRRESWPEHLRPEFADCVRRQLSGLESDLDVERRLGICEADADPAADGAIESAPLPHVAQATGDPEWYTPPDYLEAARQVLGEFDLDPATSEVAQQTVRARRYYTKCDDGLLFPWSGRVWLNPPYTRGMVDRFVAKLAQHFEAREVTSAIALVNNATETRWFRQCLDLASAACYPTGRIEFLRPSGDTSDNGALQGQAVLYLGDDVTAFRSAFEQFGPVWRPFR